MKELQGYMMLCVQKEMGKGWKEGVEEKRGNSGIQLRARIVTHCDDVFAYSGRRHELWRKNMLGFGNPWHPLISPNYFVVRHHYWTKNRNSKLQRPWALTMKKKNTITIDVTTYRWIQKSRIQFKPTPKAAFHSTHTNAQSCLPCPDYLQIR